MKTKLPISSRAIALALFCGIAFTLPVSAQVPDTLQQTLLPTPKIPQAGAHLGYCVAVDGGFAVVGAPYDDIDGVVSGVVKVFDSATGALHLVLHNPDPMNAQQFGNAVAISGTRLVVGNAKGVVGEETAGIVYVYDLASAAPSIPIFTMRNPQEMDEGAFGGAVAISGSRVVVGAGGNNAGGRPEAGNAYVYDLGSASPTVPVITIENPAPMADDGFGAAVAIEGTRVVVGTPNDQTVDESAGSVYVYDLAGASPTVPVLTLQNPAGSVNDAFGFSVGISGTLLVIGASSANLVKPAAGGAYVYDLDSASPAVPVVILPNPTPVTFDNFGRSVAISGARVVVGDPKDDTGAKDAGSVYVFDLNSTTPSAPVVTLSKPGAMAGDNFGWAAALSGTRLVVGTPNDNTGASNAGSAFVYDLAGTTPTVPMAKLNNPGPATLDHFGRSVAVSGTLMAVGAPDSDFGARGAGRVYVYDLASATATVPVAQLNNPDPADGERFGFSVAVDGTRIVVGVPLDSAGFNFTGKAYVYDLSSVTPTVPVATLAEPQPALYDQFGTSVSISGTRVVVGAPFKNIGIFQEGGSAGGAYVFDLASATPTVPMVTLSDPVLRGAAGFGYSVSISGTRVAIGAPFDRLGEGNEGSVFIYDLSGATPTVPVGALHKPATIVGDLFGYSVSISGMRVVVGAVGDDTGAVSAGSAYVFDENPRTPAFTLHNPTPLPYESFGSSVAISGERVVVASASDNASGIAAGSAYVYNLGSATPTVPAVTLTNPHPAGNDQFAYAVAIDGTTVVIGTPFDDTVKLDRGAAYVFGPNPSAASSDGLLASWKLAHFGTTTGHGPLDDDDHDGLNNLLEEAFGTDPLIADRTAVPAVINENGYLTITIAKHPGVTYLVESAPSPDPAAFSAAATTVLLDDPATLKVRDNFPIGAPPARFLRVKVIATP